MNKLVRSMANVAKMSAMQTLKSQQMVMNQTRMLHMLTNRSQIMSANIFNTQAKFAFSSSDRSTTTLYLSNVDCSIVDEDQLREKFGGYGTITKAFVIRRKGENAGDIGSGIIEFEDSDGQKAATDAGEIMTFEGNEVTYMAARAKGHPDSSAGRRGRTVFVGNVEFNTEDWQIEDFASQFGEVERVSIPKTPEGRSRGFCFIQFKDESST
jgi:RNA recognition motif-containing protein